MVGEVVDKIFRVASKLKKPIANPVVAQEKVLQYLLLVAKDTSFGIKYDFSSFVNDKDLVAQFKSRVPIFDYDSLYEHWWHRLLQGEGDVCWPGKVRNFALSSGTSGAPSKYIPITRDVQKSMRRAALRMFMSLPGCGVEPLLYEKAMLMIGGTSTLQKGGDFRMGDLSGINSDSPPFWIKKYYKPGREISKIKDWNERTDMIVKHAPSWDIGYLTGIPSWIHLTLKAIIDHYKLDNIHQMWPNLRVYVTGGVDYRPYINGFNALFGKEVLFLDSYLASEGFVAFQNRNDTDAMQLVIDNGLFFEFIPFNDDFFDDDGNVVEGAISLGIDEIEEGVDYALLLSSNAGAWRYLIGDTIRFKNKERLEINITGRTKHFLSVVGEHLSIDNMSNALIKTQEHFNLEINEYTVGVGEKNGRYHHIWYLGLESNINPNILSVFLDQCLCNVNDDYATERKAGLLGPIELRCIPEQIFYDYMERNGKKNGQAKFPRVMKGINWTKWDDYVSFKFLQNYSNSIKI